MARRRNRKPKNPSSPDLTGRREREYKVDWEDEPSRSQKRTVKFLRDRISRAFDRLDLGVRGKDRDEAYRYILGQKTHQGKKVYLNYLLPILEERHRQTIPRIPTPDLEGRSEESELVAEKCENLLDSLFTSPSTNISTILEELQWDDDTFQNGIAKIVWDLTYDKPNDLATLDSDLLAIQVERALSENDDPLSASITESDNDAAHLPVHEDGLSEVSGQELTALRDHIQEHEGRAIVVKKEMPRLERVPSGRFAYDPDVPWIERKWEAELRSVLVRDLFKAGYKNVNKENVPPEMLPEEGRVRYADLTARVWYLHDRREEKLYVFSADGPDEGYLLHQGPWPYDGPENIEVYYSYVTRPALPGFANGVATALAALPIIEELAIVDYKIQRHVDMHGDYKMLFPKGAASSAAKAALKDPNARSVELAPESLAGMKEYKPPPIPDTLLAQSQRLLDGLRAIAGVDLQDTGQPNPHQISATESASRSIKGENRKAGRQRTMGNLLAWISLTYLALFRKFGTQGIIVRAVRPEGTRYEPLNPEDIPADLEVFIDVEGESEIGRADKIAAFRGFAEFIMQSQEPVNTRKLAEDYGKLAGIKRPEKYRILQEPVGPQNIQPISGTPGVPKMESGGQGRILPFQNIKGT